MGAVPQPVDLETGAEKKQSANARKPTISSINKHDDYKSMTYFPFIWIVMTRILVTIVESKLISKPLHFFISTVLTFCTIHAVVKC